VTDSDSSASQTTKKKLCNSALIEQTSTNALHFSRWVYPAGSTIFVSVELFSLWQW